MHFLPLPVISSRQQWFNDKHDAVGNDANDDANNNDDDDVLLHNQHHERYTVCWRTDAI